MEIDEQSSILKEIPVGCVQGSVIGPRLFNIFISELDSMIGPDFFKISNSDDSYVAISCDPSQYGRHKLKLQGIVTKHFDWLKSLGMVVNPSKTEFIVFHPPRICAIWNDPLLVDNCKVLPSKNLKILLIHFSSSLDWNFHNGKKINKANSVVCAFCYLNSQITRSKFISLIHAHFISKLTYACQVWPGSVTCSLKKTRKFLLQNFTVVLQGF